MKVIAILFASLALQISLFAEGFEEVHGGAEKICAAMMEGNWEVALKAMDEKIVKQMGVNPAELEEAAKQMKEQMDALGMNIEECSVKPPKEILELESYDICFLPTSLKMTVQEQKVSGKGFLIGVKYKGAKEWRYIDAAQLTREMIINFYPEVPKDVVLPETKMEIVKPEG